MSYVRQLWFLEPAAFVITLICAACFATTERRKCDFLLFASLFTLPFTLLKSFLLIYLAHNRPERIDLYLNRIDAFVGHPANHVAMFLAHHQWLRFITRIDYDMSQSFAALTLVTVVAFQGIKEARRALVLFVTCAACSLPFYWMFPASGPIFSLPKFPAVYMGSVHLITDTNSVPNCIPSIHFATALLITYFLWPWKVGRVIGCFHIVATIFATLGLGEHYAIDLVLAVPYIWAIVTITNAVLDTGKQFTWQTAWNEATSDSAMGGMTKSS